MKKGIYNLIIVAVVVIAAIVLSNVTRNSNITIFGGGISLKDLNDTTKTSLVAFAEANATTDDQVVQAKAILNWEHQHNGFYVGTDIVGMVSTQFGVVCPVSDFRLGADVDGVRLETKLGNFTRNGVTTAGFDPQFQNFCIIAGESAPVSNAVQISLTGKTTTIQVGHQGGNKFYSFNSGNYYACIEQKICNITLSGGINFTEQTTGYASAKWANRNNVVTATGNQLGSDNQNFVVSYFRNNIPCRGCRINIGTSVWGQSQKQGVRLVAAFGMNNLNLFAQAGGNLVQDTFSPFAGLGVTYKL